MNSIILFCVMTQVFMKRELHPPHASQQRVGFTILYYIEMRMTGPIPCTMPFLNRHHHHPVWFQAKTSKENNAQFIIIR